MDPRINIISERIKNINRLIAVAGGKGGVGKSSVASVLALNLTQQGKRVGLLDLDFCGPSDHVILGIGDVFPREEKGIIPPTVNGLKFMSIIYYSGLEPAPLRGGDISDAIIELLAITRWGRLDYLIIDMPPGIKDTVLDVIRLLKRIEFLMVATQSKLTLETVRKLLAFLTEMNKPVLGVVDNMQFKHSSLVKAELAEFNQPFLGAIRFDKEFEGALGHPDKILKTQFSKDLKKAFSAYNSRN